jgi:Family of unknown function (DUF6384)
MPDISESEAAGARQRSPPQIDDLMLAMDVVDTLRHNQDLVLRELDEPRREAELIDRLREIYRSQGIAVHESVLQEGVRALKESRFVYTPPPQSWRTTLAHWWVRRHGIGRVVLGGLLAAALAWAVYEFAVVGPSERRAQELRLELTERLPRTLERAHAEASAEARVQPARDRADEIARDARSALARGDASGARTAITQLELLRADLRREYTLRIISRPNEPSGIWRIPRRNPFGRNYYLIVEPIAPDGRVLSLPITSEEDGEKATVSRWGVRVSKEVFDRVRQDKNDNGIIDNSRVGEKRRGGLEIDYLMPVQGGVILKW